jgi:hypothetical protein
MDGKRLSVTVSRAAIRHLALAAGFGGLALLGTGATVTAAAPAVAQALGLAPAMHLRGVTQGHGHSGGGGGGGTSPICWASSNWSGYALSENAVSGASCVPPTNTVYTSVSATWTVPTVQATTGTSYSAVWTGIDGFTNTSLIQAGTEQDIVNGKTHYDAWWEILPAAETVVSSVNPGDSITVTISKGTGSSWTISLTDNKGGSFTRTETYTGPGASAEWVVEAPTVGGRVATLAPYGSTVFDLATANGAAVQLPANSGGEMVQGSRFNSQVVSIPSEPDTGSPAGDGFAAAYGSTQPKPPSS